MTTFARTYFLRLFAVVKIAKSCGSSTKWKENLSVKYMKLVFGNELRIEKKNSSYQELKELVGKLEGLC